MRTCIKCQEQKSDSEYYKTNGYLSNICKKCKINSQKTPARRGYLKQYRKLNKEKFSSLNKNWRSKNKEYIKTKQKEYRENNKEQR